LSYTCSEDSDIANSCSD